MTHPKQDIKLVEILQASCLHGYDPLHSLLVHTGQRVPEEELTAFLNAESYSFQDQVHVKKERGPVIHPVPLFQNRTHSYLRSNIRFVRVNLPACIL